VRWTVYVARIEVVRNTNIFVEKPEGKTPFGRPMRKRDDNIKIYLKLME
jgi:hypothetical protein